jgi:hypothetical protein
VDAGPLAVKELPPDIRASARVDTNGEVSWPLADVRRAVAALGDAGRVILGLDARSYGNDGAVVTEASVADLSRGNAAMRQ